MGQELILEILVAILLGVTIAYCIILNRKLALMRDAQGEMQKVVRLLNGSVDRAAASVEDLRLHAHTVSEELNIKIKSGRAIADELGMMVQSGNNIADRLASVSPERQVAGKKKAPRNTSPDFLRQTLAASEIEGGNACSEEYDAASQRKLREVLETMR